MTSIKVNTTNKSSHETLKGEPIKKEITTEEDEPISLKEEMTTEENEPISVKEEMIIADKPISVKEEMTTEDEPISVKEESTKEHDEPISVKEESTTEEDEPISVKEEMTIEEDQLVGVKFSSYSNFSEDCIKSQFEEDGDKGNDIEELIPCSYVDKNNLLYLKSVLPDTDHKPFGCYLCDKHFNHKTSLKTHMRIHNDGKPL